MIDYTYDRHWKWFTYCKIVSIVNLKPSAFYSLRKWYFKTVFQLLQEVLVFENKMLEFCVSVTKIAAVFTI